jgi:hypothetical protein
MHPLARTLALHGVFVLTVGMLAGAGLHVAIRRGAREAGWHLAHAGTSGRGILLIALAGVLPGLALPPDRLRLCVDLLLFFAWSSAGAMVVGAVLNVRGQGWQPPASNKAMYAVYVAGVAAVAPAVVLLIEGLLRTAE